MSVSPEAPKSQLPRHAACFTLGAWAMLGIYEHSDTIRDVLHIPNTAEVDETTTTQDSQEFSCGPDFDIARGIIEIRAADGRSDVLVDEGGSGVSVTASRFPEQRTYLSDSLASFSHISIEGLYDRAEQASTTQDLKAVINDYAQQLGWEFNWGDGDDFPIAIGAYDNNPADGSMHIQESDLDSLRDQTVRILTEMYKHPIELIKFARVRTVNIFKAWTNLGEKYSDEDGHHLVLVLDNGTEVENVSNHEPAHAIDDEMCEGDGKIDLPFSSLNRPGFEYDENAGCANLDRTAFSSCGADHSIVEDRASVIDALMGEGLVLRPGDEGYDTILQRKLELMASRLESQPEFEGITDFFIARGMATRIQMALDNAPKSENSVTLFTDLQNR